MAVEKIKKIQQQLKAWGFDPGPIDGALGQKTKEAVMKFQESEGLSKDEIADLETLLATLNKKSCRGRGQECIGGTH